MQIKSLALSALAVVGVAAVPQRPTSFPTAIPTNFPNNPNNNAVSPIPNYPRGNGYCLTDAQATFLTQQFNFILTATDRNASGALGALLVAPDYTEFADSISMFTGQPLGQPTFVNRTDFIARAAGAPSALQVIDTIEVIHTCNRIIWEYNIQPFGSRRYPVRGFQKMVVPNPATGVLSTSDTEFNSLAFAYNVGFTCVAPPTRPA